MKVYRLGIAILSLYNFLACNEDNSCSNVCFCLEVMLVSIEVVLIRMSKNVSEVVGPSTLDGLIGTLSFPHKANMARRFSSQVLESAGPAVKIHLNSVADDQHDSSALESNVMQLKDD